MSSRAQSPSNRIRSELASDYRRIVRLKTASVAVIVAAVLVMTGVVVVAGDLRTDPTLRAVDEITVPDWVSGIVNESVEGSRWCVESCRRRTRTWDSYGSVQATAEAFGSSLTELSWEERPQRSCPGAVGASCWVRDDLFALLWVLPQQACDDSEDACVRAVILVASNVAGSRLSE
ncbi:hypothetical protein [Natronoglycomyces albus]|uniref:Uncharacterized protein n=1 Tax=Natronoglycomyces albus TaxID=2811108 RepID=A0A895XG88_9ACTN|nr:hypothetical protein [Natronoglycomyces albus]QSB03887.1 hypothetical protein JQS30_08600 [Natronoglycomyces albus]